jgi:hypothetical protein
MRPADKAENHGEEEVAQTVAKHQIATRQGSSQQGCKRTQTTPPLRKTTSYTNIFSKLVSLGSY